VLVGQLGLTVAIPILLGIGAGLFIDSKLRSSPIATLIGLLLGLASFIWVIALLVTTAQSPTKQGLHDQFANTVVVKAARAVG